MWSKFSISKSIPNQKSVRVFNEFLLLVLSDKGLLLDFLDHRLGSDVDFVLLESRHGVVTMGKPDEFWRTGQSERRSTSNSHELLREHGKNVGEGLDQSDLDAGGELRVPL